ncbi:MAG: hypothetical protein A2Y25_01900 [Candidatus Melainabacteria bacterium GWF2_37_15]|nr:MAG: hypothetical protein A2Y25_01900 [Candidatus Melainabacteria bacterium GWF2_37_15]
MFQKNIDAIRSKNPQLAEKLEKINLESVQDITVGEAETKDLIIAYKDLALHSTIDPIREANAIWNKAVHTELKKNDIQIVFGLGLGYLFKRAYVNSGSKIFLFEPMPEVLRFVLEHVDFSAELTDKRVYITDNVKDITEKLSSEYLQGDRAEFMFLPAYASITQDIMQDLTTRLVKVLEEKSADVSTIFRFAQGWTKNFITNLPHFFEFRPLGYFKDTFADKNALIIAAGPSLQENIEKIKKNKDKFITIAVGKALRVLAENNIVPDFVTFADARNLELQVQGLEHVIAKTNIIMTIKTDSKISALKAKNKILYLPETDPYTNLFIKHSSLDPGSYESASSISIINYFIAKTLGFRNIAFVGLDLAFPDNKIYATGESLKIDENGYIQMKNVQKSNRKVGYVKDKDGNTLATRDDYMIFIRQLEGILEEDTSLSRVINTSTRGAYINGMDYVDFDSYVKKISELNINVNEIISGMNAKTGNVWHECMQKVSKEIYDKHVEIKQINEKSVLALNDITVMIETLETETECKPDHDSLGDLQFMLNELKSRLMNNIILQNSLQGELWIYTKNYKTQNMHEKTTILNNLNVERRLFSRVYKHSSDILSCMENPCESVKSY